MFVNRGHRTARVDKHLGVVRCLSKTRAIPKTFTETIYTIYVDVLREVSSQADEGYSFLGKTIVFFGHIKGQEDLEEAGQSGGLTMLQIEIENYREKQIEIYLERTIMAGSKGEICDNEHATRR